MGRDDLRTKPDGSTYLDRTTLTPQPDGRVSQHIQVSMDGGATWSDGWVGLYVPVQSPGSGAVAADPSS